jgi:hypothetical protein
VWPIHGIVLAAPEGTLFLSGLVRDFDGDGALDAFALVRAADGSGASSLVYYRGQHLAEKLVPSSLVEPPALARDPSCVDDAKLTAVGGRSVLVELGAVCAAQTHPDRWVAVVDAAGVAAVLRLGLVVADPPGMGALSIDGEVADRDGDGRDDVRLVATLEGGGAPFEPGPRISASFVWLDRPAGLSPDAHVAASSFASLVSLAAARAARAKDAPEVPAFVAQVRALWRAACAEGGAPRLVGVAGTSGVSCGASRALEEGGLAEARAYATMGDGLRAALALHRVERPPSGISAARAADAEKWLVQADPVASVRTVRAIAAVPALATGHEPRWGSLAFEASGKLLVRTRAGVVRVDPDAGDEASAEGIDWRQAVTSPDGAMHWIETYDPCDGFALRATFASGDDMRDVPLPVAPPLGGRCAGSRGAPAPALPVAWSAAGLEAIVDGVPVLVAADLGRASLLATFLDRPAALGAPLSPDGKTIVVPTHEGLIERGPARTRLLRGAGLDGTFDDQRDCAASNDGTHVACVRGGKAWVGTWD